MDRYTIVHHALTILALSLVPVVWVFMNVFTGRTTLARVYRAWNEQRLSEEPWGIFDKNYIP
jgi:hypothetical protein